ncbi:MAG: DUF3048 domain-containing protein [Actinobacteria bacterium]|nr:DUF3048 domain-containing protein [Actinomycetota bacterium]
MEKKRNSVAKVLIIGTVILGFLMVLTFAGCKGKSVTETTVTGATTSSATTAAETTAAGTQETTGKFDGQPITGNINKFSGLEISDKVLNSRPIAIMIENSPDARPQSGLINADVVFEVVDEGGVTRFVSVFSSYDAAVVGPVRSARPYYAEIARSFDPIYVFWGTAPQFYKVVEDLGLNYLTPLGDESGNSSISANFIDNNGIDSKRDSTRVAPHNAYMFTPRIKELAKKAGYSLDGGQSPLTFKEDAAETDRGNISKVTVDFSSPQFKAEFDYNSNTNTYLKSVAGSPSMDRESGKQIELNNVIVMVTDIANSGDSAGHMIVRTTQQGIAYYFLDGKVMTGKWMRNSALEPFTFIDQDGNTVLFNRGKTWVAVVSGIDRVTY